MPIPSVLVSTWDNGVFKVRETGVQHELPGRTVRSLTSNGRGGVLAIVGGHALSLRSPDGVWTEITTNQADLSCCVALGDIIFVGTDDARILRIDADGAEEWLTAFDTVEGSDSWYAGTAVIDGRVVGPPLGIRSLTVTSGGALLANVHVGGIPRSTDGGLTWRPTIDVASDVHQVCAHPLRPEIVIAAAAVGLCASRDGGVTWIIEHRGLHANHCSGVAFGRKDIFISASTDPFSQDGVVYRRAIDSNGPLMPLAGGIPQWLGGVADTDCITTRDAVVAVIDRAGSIYLSPNDGDTWSQPFAPVPGASGLYIY